jgi:ketosteroid isomerase-like protein
MNANEKLMKDFYTALDKRDWQAMADCYSPDVIFNDPAFGVLQNGDPQRMWEMLCRQAKDLRVEVSNIHSDEEYGTCNWVAQYHFSATGRRVENHIKAYMRFADGKIIEHTDEFNLYKWSGMALGLPGWLLGWSGFMQRKIRARALGNLEKFKLRQPSA